VVKEKAKEGLESLKKELRRVVLAGVGAAVLAKEGAAGLAKKWLAKGEEVEPELKKALEKLGKKRDEVREKAGEGAKKVWGYLPVVTKKDFAELAKRIDALAVKVESLRKKK
jgi:polyhydroxyalkanoate synthesis regulator phasin